jgi:hypothetical protein
MFLKLHNDGDVFSKNSKWVGWGEMGGVQACYMKR